MRKAFTRGILTSTVIDKAQVRNCIKMGISMRENGLMIIQMARGGSSRQMVTTTRAAGKMGKLMDTEGIQRMMVKSISAIGRMTSKMATVGKSGQTNLGTRAHSEMA